MHSLAWQTIFVHNWELLDLRTRMLGSPRDTDVQARDPIWPVALVTFAASAAAELQSTKLTNTHRKQPTTQTPT